MRVISGIAVSFDGKTSRYLPLPPLLPSRPSAWQPSSASPNASKKPPSIRGARSLSPGGGGGQGVGRGGVWANWETLPGGAVETIALFVSCHAVAIQRVLVGCRKACRTSLESK